MTPPLPPFSSAGSADGGSARQPVLAVIDDERFDEHRARGGHPECPERLQAARSGLYGAVPDSARVALGSRRASEQELSRVHSPAYVRALAGQLESGSGHLDPDTYFSPGTEQAAWLAAGAAAELGAQLARGEMKRGLALLRPPGHHAEPARAMGFCMLNNIAVAAATARSAGAERVAIVDFDVHHGNGTQAAFYDDPSVLFISTHQYPFYPGTGAPNEIGQGAGAGYTVNLALPVQQGPQTYAHAFRRVVLPVLRHFSPDLILVSAGYDGHERDPLASMALDTASYAAMTSSLVELAEELGHGRIACLLEGGYDLHAIADGVAATARALLGERTALPEDRPGERGRTAVQQTVDALRAHWPFR